MWIKRIDLDWNLGTHRESVNEANAFRQLFAKAGIYVVAPVALAIDDIRVLELRLFVTSTELWVDQPLVTTFRYNGSTLRPACGFPSRKQFGRDGGKWNREQQRYDEERENRPSFRFFVVHKSPHQGDWLV